MRKNTARHWLHAALDLLPIILIPVFMIYSHRHTIDSGSIQVQEQVGLDFNQICNYQQLSNTYTNGNLVLTNNHDGSFTLSGNTDIDKTIYIDMPQGSHSNHKVFYYPQIYNDNVLTISFYSGYNLLVQDSQILNTGSYLFVKSGYNMTTTFYLQCFDVTNMNLTNLTFQQFNSMFPNSYYPYVESKKILVDKPIQTIYNDTDIMSQFTYQLYNAVDKYFNMGNVFGMNNVYQWFELNIFGGSAPLYIYIVWQIVLYEFVMDLLFLLYGLFMWFVDMCKALMEKPLHSIN